VNVAVLEEEALVVRLGIVHDVELGPKVAVVQHRALVVARPIVFNVEVVNVDDVVQFRAASVVARRAVVDRRVFGARGTIVARFERIARLEEEALHVVNRIIGDAEHGEELALLDRLTFDLTRITIGDVVEEDVDHVVQRDRTRTVRERTIRRIRSRDVLRQSDDREASQRAYSPKDASRHLDSTLATCEVKFLPPNVPGERCG